MHHYIPAIHTYVQNIVKIRKRSFFERTEEREIHRRICLDLFIFLLFKNFFLLLSNTFILD